MSAMPANVEELIPTRQSLLSRLKDWDDRDSWQDFFDTYWQLIYGVARKAGLSETEAEEVVQETVIAVAKQMPEFHYDPERGSFKGWLLTQTRWRIGDQFRKRGRELPPAAGVVAAPVDRTPTSAAIPDPNGPELEALWDAEWEKNLLHAALERVKRKVSARQYQIFDLAMLQEVPMAQVKRVLKVNAAQVYLARHRVGALVKKELRRLEAQQL